MPECCGFGGTFSARHPAPSRVMVNDKLDSLRDSGTEVVVSADCGCLLDLHHAGEKRRLAGKRLRAPGQLPAQAYGRYRCGAAVHRQNPLDPPLP